MDAETPRHSDHGLAICRRWLWSCAPAPSRNIPRDHPRIRCRPYPSPLDPFRIPAIFALAVYLFNAGRSALSIAKGCPRPKARFGWGKMLLGMIFLFSYAAQHFHLIPARFNGLEPSNQTQAVTMNVTSIAICAGCILLVISGIWRGFRRPPPEPSLSANE